MPRKTIGIDPGLTGALALIVDDECIRVIDMPTMEKTHGRGKEVNPYVLADQIMGLIADSGGTERDVTVCIERVSAMPGQGVTSMFSFGHSAGVIDGVCGGLSLSTAYVTPARWKRSLGIAGRPKSTSITVATRLYPEVSDMLRRRKDIGRADAILIAHYHHSIGVGS